MGVVWDTIIIAICAIVIFAMGLYLGFTYGNSTPSSFGGQPLTSLNISTCQNLSLKDAAECYREVIGPIYNYTVREDTDKTLEDIKTNGGDCYDYSLLYVKLAKNDGLYAQQLSFQSSNSSYHAVAVIADDKYGYCILDQLANPYCTPLGNRTKVQENNVTTI